MKPLYKHIIKVIEAPFLPAYGEDKDTIVVTEQNNVDYSYSYDKMSKVDGEVVYTWKNGDDVVETAKRYPSVGDEVTSGGGQDCGVIKSFSNNIISYKGMLVDKDDATKKIEVNSEVHVIDPSKELSNDNALVYFTIGEDALHNMEVGTKLIWSIYQADRKGYWTSKAPAYKVTETAITDTQTTSSNE